MRVQTIQGYDLRAFTGRIELERGTYKARSKISCAQRRLYHLVKEDQLVWCAQGELMLFAEAGRHLHEIDIDCRDIAAVVDSLVWCHIVYDDPRYIPAEEERGLWRQVVSSGVEDCDAAFKNAKDEYLAANRPDNLWSAIIKSEITRKSDQLLVKFPFEHSKIVSVQVVSKEMANGRYKR